MYWVFIFIGIRRFDRSRPQADDTKRTQQLACDLIIPAYNEKSHLPLIASLIVGARTAAIPTFLIDDGSQDGSSSCLAALCRRSGAHLLSHAANQGKAAALRTGLDAATAPYVVLVDADTGLALPPTGKATIAPGVAAVAFTVAAAENGRHLVAAQAVEYEYVLNFERAALAGLGIVLTVPGAATLWRTEALRAVGGFSSRTCAEDTDATIALQMAGFRVMVDPAIIARTDCPATLGTLVRQRRRWVWGNLQVACYAAVACCRDRTIVNRAPALVLIAASAMNVTGYAIAAVAATRLLLLEAGLVDLAASVVLCGVTAARVAVCRRFRDLGRCGLLGTLVSLLFMQMINFAGFCYGAAAILTSRRLW